MALNLAVSIFVIFVLYYYVIHPYFVSTLSKIPNAHFSSPVSSVWVHWKRYSGKEVNAVNQAFRTKGPIVRLGPRDIALNIVEKGVKTVHGGGFEKPDWYTLWQNYGYVNTFSALGKDHLTCRRRITNVYAKSYIQRNVHFLKIIHTLLGRMSPHFSSSARTRTPIDVLALNMAYGLDVVSAFTFGIPQGTNFIHDVHARNYWFGTYLKAFPSDYMFWLLYAPGLRKWAHRIGITIAPDWIGEARRNLEQWTLQIVDNTEEALRKRSVEDMPDGDVPIVYNQLKLAHAKERYAKGADLALAPPSEERLQIASECLDHLIATRDVFGIAYTFVVYEISRHQEAQRKLHKELQSLTKPLKLPLGPSTSHLPTATELESLPLLNAMIKESLRLRGTLPTPNPRVTPLDKITTIGPYESIPGGIRISSFAWCLHRNEKVFPDCENWRPERWLGELGDLGEQERWFWTFGSGSRMCVGDSLAIEMIRYAVALVFTNFHTSVIVSEGFGKDRQWVIGKPDEKLVLQFNEIHAEKA